MQGVSGVADAHDDPQWGLLPVIYLCHLDGGNVA